MPKKQKVEILFRTKTRRRTKPRPLNHRKKLPPKSSYR